MNDDLIISGLTKAYKDFMLNGDSFSVPCGSIVGLTGENGAGKSITSMQCWDQSVFQNCFLADVRHNLWEICAK